MDHRASMLLLVQLFASSCALPEVGAGVHATDAGALPSKAHSLDASKPDASPIGQHADAAMRADPAEVEPPKPNTPDKMPDQLGTPAGSGSVMPKVQRCRIEPAAQDVTQTIWVLVDGSGSMLEPLADKSRWLALREALLDNASGVVRAVAQVRWGLALYDGPLPGGPGPLPDGGVQMPSVPPATTCPRLIYVDPQPENFAAINVVYPLDPLGGSTPTHMALSALSAKIAAAPAPAGEKTSVVLATDGEPNDFCSMVTPPPDPKSDVLAAVQKLDQAGVKTYVISLAGEDHVLGEHLQQVAQAGGSGQPAFAPANRSELIDTLRKIASVTPSCEVKLARALDPLRACDGEVELAGKPLTCNAADGFSLRDHERLRLTGSACAQYQASPDVLEISYPCDALR